MEIKWEKLPGWIATVLVSFLNAVWLFWGLGESFFEGWGVPGTPWLLFLVIGTAGILFSILAIKVPYVGGGILIAAGSVFAIWWLIPGIINGLYTLSTVIERLFLSGGFAIVGALFILDGLLTKAKKDVPVRPWITRNVRLLLAIGIPLLTGLAVAGYNLPIVLQRVDDGDRTARLIEGNGVRLVWAPAGPGWNWKQDFGGYPSWQSLATYGISPIGLDSKKLEDLPASESDMDKFGVCAYLDEAGTRILSKPQYIWRMPTVDEIVRSLSLHNVNAECVWNGTIGRLTCARNPDKETPLWAPDQPPVYYWAADEYNDEDAYYVSYSGFVNHQPKSWGNPRHGYRCVKEP